MDAFFLVGFGSVGYFWLFSVFRHLGVGCLGGLCLGVWGCAYIFSVCFLGFICVCFFLCFVRFGVAFGGCSVPVRFS